MKKSVTEMSVEDDVSLSSIVRARKSVLCGSGEQRETSTRRRHPGLVYYLL
jgi:hypothetical protein